MRYGSGIPVATVWEGDYDISVKLKNSQADSANSCDLEDELIPVAGGLANVPLRQVADVFRHGRTDRLYVATAFIRLLSWQTFSAVRMVWT